MRVKITADFLGALDSNESVYYRSLGQVIEKDGNKYFEVDVPDNTIGFMAWMEKHLKDDRVYISQGEIRINNDYD